MDYFSHGFWSYIFFHRTKKPLWAVFFGLLPDTMSWGIYFFFNIFTGKLFTGPPQIDRIPEWVFTLYGISHSLIIWGLAALILCIIWKKVPVYLFAAPIAIAMDAITHSREFLPTPIFWPVFDWKFPGFSWGTSWFMILNYSLITFSLIYIIYKKKKKK